MRFGLTEPDQPFSAELFWKLVPTDLTFSLTVSYCFFSVGRTGDELFGCVQRIEDFGYQWAVRPLLVEEFAQLDTAQQCRPAQSQTADGRQYGQQEPRRDKARSVAGFGDSTSSGRYLVSRYCARPPGARCLGAARTGR